MWNFVAWTFFLFEYYRNTLRNGIPISFILLIKMSTKHFIIMAHMSFFQKFFMCSNQRRNIHTTLFCPMQPLTLTLHKFHKILTRSKKKHQNLETTQPLIVICSIFSSLSTPYLYRELGMKEYVLILTVSKLMRFYYFLVLKYR